jgi:hypothetical protein
VASCRDRKTERGRGSRAQSTARPRVGTRTYFPASCQICTAFVSSNRRQDRFRHGSGSTTGKLQTRRGNVSERAKLAEEANNEPAVTAPTEATAVATSVERFPSINPKAAARMSSDSVMTPTSAWRKMGSARLHSGETAGTTYGGRGSRRRRSSHGEGDREQCPWHQRASRLFRGEVRSG